MVIVTEFSKGFLVVFILLHIELILNFIEKLISLKTDVIETIVGS